MRSGIVSVTVALLCASGAATAAVSEDEFRQLQQSLQDALARIAELERAAATARPSAVQPPATEPSEPVVAPEQATQVATLESRLDQMAWVERIRLQGDFRYRYQPEEASGRLDAANQPLADVSRNRQRIRARAAVIAAPSDTVELGFGMATGGDSAVSANQTLGGGGAKKELNVDLAYFDWSLSDNARLAGGKFKNRFVDVGSAGLLWDSDWRPEGFDVRYTGELFYATGLATWLAADGSDGSGGSFNYGVQLGLQPELAGVSLDLGVGYWHLSTEGRECYEREGREGSSCFGNTSFDGADLARGGRYLMDYTPVELYASASFDTAVPLRVFADYVRNVDAVAVPTGPSAGRKLDSAYAVGASLGAGKRPGDWQLRAYYQDKEADSVLGLLTDSDFGNGGTDHKGYVVEGKYVVTDFLSVTGKYQAAERQDSNGVENGSPLTANPYDVDIWQLDLQFKYK